MDPAEGRQRQFWASFTGAFLKMYVVVAAIVLFGGVPIMLLGMAYFGGGVGSALNSFRMGLREQVLNWVFLLPLAFLPAYVWLSSHRGARPSLPAALIVAASSLFTLFLLFGWVEDEPVSERPSACHRGVYTLADGRLMAVSQSPVAALNVDLSDGTRIMTWGSENEYSGTACIGPDADEGGGFQMVAPSCPAAQLKVLTHDAPEQIARRVPIKETDASFEAEGLTFRARLFHSLDRRDAPLIIIPAHRDGVSRLDWGYSHYLLAGLGFSVLVYDKPEKWPYGFNETRSDNDAKSYASAALAKALSVVPSATTRVGFFGDRDALLAAAHADVDFTIVDASSVPAGLFNRVSSPVLWLVPSNHTGAPQRSLVQRLNASGKDITLVVLPPVDEHGAWYEMRDSARCHINEPPHYWRTLRAWLMERATQD